MSSWAKPGVKCVCIRNGTPTCDGAVALGGHYPIIDLIYTIADVRSLPGGLGLVFEEIPDAGPGTGWGIYAFRPLVARTQGEDVAKFRHLLSPSPVDVGLIPAGVELVE